ncbi:MAG: DivIVA domain-containing protein [Eubacterium sp.]|nr:DivIVA domain-containing protein [Eubacterium sp.]
MLTPQELQAKKVEPKRKKYIQAEMDEFLNLTMNSYTEVYNANDQLTKDKERLQEDKKRLEKQVDELNSQVKTLSDGIQYYKSIETTLQKALVLAEKTSKETKDAAVLKAEAIEKDANNKAEEIIRNAEAEYETLREKCLVLMDQFNNYKSQLRQVATAQLEYISGDSFQVDEPEVDEELIESFHKDQSPSSIGADPTPVAEAPVSEENHVASQEAPVVEETPVVEEAPVVDQTPVAEDVPAYEETPVPEVEPLPDETPAPVDEPLPVETSEPEVAPVVEETPEEPKVEHFGAAPAPAPAPAATEDEDLPVEYETPEINDSNLIESNSDLGETNVLPDLKDSIAEKEEKTDDETIDILTADTIDLSASLQNVQKKTEAIPSNTQLEVEPKKVETLDELPSTYKNQNTERLEPVNPEETEAPTLDSLLQSMNMAKNSGKEGQEEDPFEFLGSVDDF